MCMIYSMSVALVLTLLAAAQAQELPVFRAETSLATVRFHVIKQNKYVDTLTAQDIVLLEDGQPRKVTFFEGGRGSRQRATPIEVTLLFDISGSVTEEGLLDFLAYKSALMLGLPNVKLAVYGFDGNLKRFCHPTMDEAVLTEAFRRIQNYKAGAKPRPEVIKLQLPPKRKSNNGGTWIYESALAAAKEAAKSGSDATKLILMFSDGFPTTDAKPKDVTGEISEMGISVYPVLLGGKKIKDRIRHIMESGRNKQGELSDGAKNQLAHIELQQHDIMDYASLGELTGGRSFDPIMMNAQAMRALLGGIAQVVLFEYIAGFQPATMSDPPTKHKLTVKLQAKETGKVSGGTRTILH